MLVKVERDEVIAAIRGLVDDNIAFTSPELAGEFTMTAVAERLGTTRRAVRSAFNTIAEAAAGVRLQKMDEFFDRMNGASQGSPPARQGRLDGGGRSGTELVEPHVRFRIMCDHLTDYETYHFFLDSAPVFREFERRVIAAFTDVLKDGITRGAFDVPSVPGAAQLAFDVLRVLAIEARSEDDEIGSLAFAVDAAKPASTYHNHVDLLLRSWGWMAGADGSAARDLPPAGRTAVHAST